MPNNHHNNISFIMEHFSLNKPLYDEDYEFDLDTRDYVRNVLPSVKDTIMNLLKNPYKIDYIYRKNLTINIRDFYFDKVRNYGFSKNMRIESSMYEAFRNMMLNLPQESLFDMITDPIRQNSEFMNMTFTEQWETFSELNPQFSIDEFFMDLAFVVKFLNIKSYTDFRMIALNIYCEFNDYKPNSDMIEFILNFISSYSNPDSRF